MMGIQLTERAIDDFRNSTGKKKTEIWKQKKTEIIAQGLTSEGRRKDRDEFLNRKTN